MKTTCYAGGSKKLLAWYSNKKPPNVKDKKGFPTNLIKTLGGLSMKDKNSLAHTTWNCKYHIVFAPKYRRQEIYGKYKVSIGQIIRELCERKGV